MVTNRSLHRVRRGVPALHLHQAAALNRLALARTGSRPKRAAPVEVVPIRTSDLRFRRSTLKVCGIAKVSSSVATWAKEPPNPPSGASARVVRGEDSPEAPQRQGLVQLSTRRDVDHLLAAPQPRFVLHPGGRRRGRPGERSAEAGAAKVAQPQRAPSRPPRPIAPIDFATDSPTARTHRRRRRRTSPGFAGDGPSARNRPVLRRRAA